jgi:hypothetical protein
MQRAHVLQEDSGCDHSASAAATCWYMKAALHAAQTLKVHWLGVDPLIVHASLCMLLQALHIERNQESQAYSCHSLYSSMYRACSSKYKL